MKLTGGGGDLGIYDGATDTIYVSVTVIDAFENAEGGDLQLDATIAHEVAHHLEFINGGFNSVEMGNAVEIKLFGGLVRLDTMASFPDWAKDEI